MNPSLYYSLVKGIYRVKSGLRGVKVVNNLKGVETILRQMEEMAAESPLKAIDFARTWFYLPTFKNLDQPHSAVYRQEQRRLYEAFSGKAWGTFETVDQLEEIPFERLSDLYPYGGHDGKLVGAHLQRTGFWLATMNIPRHSRVVEFGAGSGELALQLAQTGADVLVTDISKVYTSVIERKAKILGAQIQTQVTDMAKFTTQTPFDAAIFCESFHHAENHLELLQTLKSVVKPGGKVFLCGEPITYYPYPWGVRTDGESIWMARKFAWLEYGFDRHYFRDLVQSQGWHFTCTRNKSIDHAAYVISLTKTAI